MNKSLALLTVTLLLGGCQSLIHKTPDGTPPVEDTAVETKAKPEKYGSFSEDSLYSLLVAELAGQRNRFDIALSNYVVQAQKTRDPGVSERAFRIAEYLGADQEALDTSLLWARSSPDNLDAQRAAAIQLARAGRYESPWCTWRRSSTARATRTSTSSPCLPRRPTRIPAPACCRASTTC